jgi:hypothetical protein
MTWHEAIEMVSDSFIKIVLKKNGWVWGLMSRELEGPSIDNIFKSNGC